MSLSGMPRPLKFNSLNEFVMASSNNFEESYSKPRSPKNGVFVIRNQESLYDRYNVNNLLLSKVHKSHIQVVSKNLVLNEQDINPNKILAQTLGATSKPLAQTSFQPKQNNFLQTNITGINYTEVGATSPKKPIAHTSQGFYIPQEQKSKEYSENQLLFNFNKIADEKKAKKKQFLQNIEAKLNMIEQQANELQEYHFQEEMNLHQIEKIKDEMGKQLTTNAFNGRITQKIQNNLQIQDQQDEDYEDRKPKSLHLNMGHVEINHVLESHFDQNQRLLDEIVRVKSKSKDKSSANNTSSQWNQSPGKSKQFERTGVNQQFNKTSMSQGKGKSLLQTENHKKIISATMRMPPKHGAKR